MNTRGWTTGLALVAAAGAASAAMAGEDAIEFEASLALSTRVLSQPNEDAAEPVRLGFFDRIKHVNLNEDGSNWASFGGDFRVRAELWDGFAFKSGLDGSFVLGRALLHGDFHFGDRIRVFAEVESAISSDRDLPGGRRTLDVDELDLQNLFVDVILTTGDDRTVTARLGRQEFVFGKERLVSALPWSNSQRSWDGARVIVEQGRWRVDGFFSRFAAVDKYEFNDWATGPNFFGIYAAGKVGPEDRPMELDLYWLGLDKELSAFNGSAGAEDRHTIGARLGGKLGESGFDFDVEGAYQFGDVGSADIRAWFIASQVGYAFEGEWAPRVYAGFDYASGDDTPGDGKVETFNQLFPLGHAYHGFMDFVGRQNVVDASVGVSVRPTEKLTVKVDGHWFWRASTADALYNAGGGVVRAGGLSGASEVGQEIDVTGVYKVDGRLTVQAGYSHFFAGDFLDQSGSGADMDWFYLQTVFKF